MNGFVHKSDFISGISYNLTHFSTLVEASHITKIDSHEYIDSLRVKMEFLALHNMNAYHLL